MRWRLVRNLAARFSDQASHREFLDLFLSTGGWVLIPSKCGWRRGGVLARRARKHAPTGTRVPSNEGNEGAEGVPVVRRAQMIGGGGGGGVRGNGTRPSVHIQTAAELGFSVTQGSTLAQLGGMLGLGGVVVSRDVARVLKVLERQASEATSEVPHTQPAPKLTPSPLCQSVSQSVSQSSQSVSQAARRTSGPSLSQSEF